MKYFSRVLELATYTPFYWLCKCEIHVCSFRHIDLCISNTEKKPVNTYRCTNISSN